MLSFVFWCILPLCLCQHIPKSTRKETKDTSSKSGGVVSDNYIKNQDYQLPPPLVSLMYLTNTHFFFKNRTPNLNIRKPKPTNQPSNQPKNQLANQPNPTQPNPTQPNPTQPNPTTHHPHPLPFLRCVSGVAGRQEQPSTTDPRSQASCLGTGEGWLVGWLVGWSVGWLVGWLVGWGVCVVGMFWWCWCFARFFGGEGWVGGRLVDVGWCFFFFHFLFVLFVCGWGVWVWVLRGHFFFYVCFFGGEEGEWWWHTFLGALVTLGMMRTRSECSLISIQLVIFGSGDLVLRSE